VPLEGLEPPTVSLGRNCSSIELQRLAARVYPVLGTGDGHPGVQLGCKAMSENAGRPAVGTSAWQKPQWRGGFYPAGLVHRRELEYFSRRLTSLEINATYYGLQRPTSFDKWRDETPDDFVFAIKGYGRVTQTPHLRNPRPKLADFFASGVLQLEHKLGPLLWQLPPELTLQLDELERLVEHLPRTFEAAAALAAESETAEANEAHLADRPIRHAIEIRNASFVDPRFFELLRANNVAVAFTNSPEHPETRELTADFVYARLSSGPGHHPDGYDDATLDAWASQITGWLDGPPARDAFVYFNNPNGDLPHTPFNALRLLERLRSATSERAEGGQLF
jgi:uncharacterized protein YecE (DUF72 family)